MRVTIHPVGLLQANCYIVEDETTGRSVVIDPGGDAGQLLEALRRRALTPDAIWLTHGHLDHVGAVAELRRATDAPILLHPADRPLYDGAAEWGAVWGVTLEQPPPPDAAIADGDELCVGACRFTVLHTPGHAPGHVVFHGQGVVFAGDLLFAGSIGRTDLPYADPMLMAASLERIAALESSTVVNPGHGPATAIGRERASNPFLNGTMRVVGAGR